MKMEKIGEVNLGKFKTEFKITPKVKKFIFLYNSVDNLMKK